MCRHLGDGQAALHDAFRLAQLCAPTVLVVDDIDTICGIRKDSTEQQSFMPVLSALLIEMDNIDEGALIMLSPA